ncbi:MAG TPA: AraC family transcriptional regulator [Chitinophagaceae bacterium]
MTLYIKNMVCPRCISSVEQLLTEININPLSVQLGVVILKEELSQKKLESFSVRLKQLGFELLDNARKQQIEKIKSIVIEYVHFKEDEKINFSDLLSKRLHKAYSHISKLFSETEGITIEQFVILQRVEKVKELLAYDEMNLSEIAFKLTYSSVAHLSAQFKKVTGLTPSQFKAQGIHLRKSLDNIKGH